jgi:hypothetical protein
MIKSTGILRCEPKFVYLECDPEIARLYRYFCRKKGVYLIRQWRDSHITVIRTEEFSAQMSIGKYFDGTEFEFVYNPEYLQSNATHYWVRILSPGLEKFRTDMSFCSQPAKIVNGKLVTDPFHLTMGRLQHTA